MNKRLIKKKISKHQQFDGKIFVTGNNGGDMLDILDNGDGTIYLKSGSSCVTSIDATVPVEFLTAIISQKMLECGDVFEVINSFGWDKEFKEKLKSKVSRWRDKQC